MATLPQGHLAVDEDGNYLVTGADYPGHTVDLLIEQGRVEEARDELQRLCLKGLNSGEPVRMTPAKWQDFRLELHRKAGLLS